MEEYVSETDEEGESQNEVRSISGWPRRVNVSQGDQRGWNVSIGSQQGWRTTTDANQEENVRRRSHWNYGRRYPNSMEYARSQQVRYGRGGIVSMNRNTDWERAAEAEEERLRTTGTWGIPTGPAWGSALRRQDSSLEENKDNYDDEELNWIRTMNAALERSDYERMGTIDHSIGNSWSSPYGDSTGPMGMFERNMDLINPGWRNQVRVRQRDTETSDENVQRNLRSVRRAILQDDEILGQEKKEENKENKPPE